MALHEQTREELVSLLVRAALDICALQDRAARLSMDGPEDTNILRLEHARALRENRELRLILTAGLAKDETTRLRISRQLQRQLTASPILRRVLEDGSLPEGSDGE